VEFEFSGKINLEDYIKYNKYIYKNIDKYIIGTAFVIIIIYSIIKILKYFRNIKLNNNYINNIKSLSENNNSQLEDLINVSSNVNIVFEVILPIILFILLFSVLYFVLYKLCIEKIFYEKICAKYYDSNKLLNEYSNFKIGKDSITISSNSGNIIITNDKILKVLYDEDSIYIFIGLNMAYIIKKRYFDNDRTFDSLIIFMKENYKSK
jgi:lipopolysaccharide export LptBFGC system permease protein LptF